MTNTEAKAHCDRQMDLIKAKLDDLGIGWEQHGIFIEFPNEQGECVVFPSQRYDGKIFIQCVMNKWADTADEVLTICGVSGG